MPFNAFHLLWLEAIWRDGSTLNTARNGVEMWWPDVACAWRNKDEKTACPGSAGQNRQGGALKRSRCGSH